MLKIKFWTNCEPVTRGDPSRRYYPPRQLEWPSTSRRGPSRTSPSKVRSSACARLLKLKPTYDGGSATRTAKLRVAEPQLELSII